MSEAENEVMKFTKHQLKFLKDLRLVYDDFNDKFCESFYGEYVPIGLFIVHFVTLENYYNQGHEDYKSLVNQRYLDIAYELSKRIKDTPELVFCLDNSEYVDGVLSRHIIKLEKEQDDNYFGVLISKISYQNLIKWINETPHLSSNDKSINVVNEIYRLVKTGLAKTNPYLCWDNDILYYPVKDNIQHNKEFEFHTVIANVRDLLIDENEDNKKPTANKVWGEIVSLLETDNKDSIFNNLTIIYDEQENKVTWTSSDYADTQIKYTSFSVVYSKVNRKYPLMQS